MSILFYRIVLLLFAAIFFIAGFGEELQCNRYVDYAFTVILLLILFATFAWHL